MAVRITSRVASGPLWIPLSSGEQLRLAPGQTSEEHPDVEVQDNSSVDSLVSRGLIDVVPVGGSRRGRSAGKNQAAGQRSAGSESSGDEQ
jgi:hypothetical protein